MKIDMSSSAITLRLRQVSQLRRACLMLARSPIGLRIRQRHAANELVQRTSLHSAADLSVGRKIFKIRDDGKLKRGRKR